MLDFFATQTSTSLIGGQGERLVNCFLRPTSGATEGELIAASGLHVVADFGSAPEAGLEFGGKPHVVAGGQLWRVDGGTPVALGTLPTGPASMATSGRQIAIVSGGQYFVYDGATLSTHATGQVSTPASVVFKDGYFIVRGSDATRSDIFTISSLDDGKTINALDFAYAESAPDGIVGMIVDHSELWLFGARTTEVWFNTGNASFPFERNSGALRERGCLDGATIAKEDNSVFWIGEDRVAYRSSGGSPAVISTPEIEETLKTAEVLGAFVFKDRGHKFYAVRTPTTTFCYDLTTGLWSERARGGDMGPASMAGAFRVGDQEYIWTTTGKLAVLDDRSFDDDGKPVVMMAQSRPLVQRGERFTVRELKVFFRSGIFGSVPAPQAMVQISRDGREWEREKWRNIAGKGEYGAFARWASLGQFRRAQFRIKVSDAVHRDILGISYG